MVTHLKRLATLALVFALWVPLMRVRTARAQEGDEVRRLMDSMSSGARVGQLFLVTFPGAEVTENAAIAELIQDYQVGGVVLRAENGNIANQGDATAQVAALVDQLQQAAWAATQPVTETLGEGEASEVPFVPLFVGVNHEGNGMPFTSIIGGMAPLPSEMALGGYVEPQPH